jgi:hypothetical protein
LRFKILELHRVVEAKLFLLISANPTEFRRDIELSLEATGSSCINNTTMARNRKDKDAKIPLKKPDRSGPDPSQETLLQMAEQRGLLNIPQAVGKGKNKAEPAADEEPLIGRLGESMLWTFSLTMLHFSMDVLVARQYAVEIEWDKLFKRSLQAFPGSFLPFLSPNLC